MHILKCRYSNIQCPTSLRYSYTCTVKLQLNSMRLITLQKTKPTYKKLAEQNGSIWNELVLQNFTIELRIATLDSSRNGISKSINMAPVELRKLSFGATAPSMFYRVSIVVFNAIIFILLFHFFQRGDICPCPQKQLSGKINQIILQLQLLQYNNKNIL